MFRLVRRRKHQDFGWVTFNMEMGEGHNATVLDNLESSDGSGPSILDIDNSHFRSPVYLHLRIAELNM